MNNVSLFLAFSAGLLSFLSPCVLPLVPAYITFLTGNTIVEIKKNNIRINLIKESIEFCIGFSIIFILLGASVSSLSKYVMFHQDILRKIGGIVIIIFGLHTAGIIKIKFLYYQKSPFDISSISKNASSILLGMAFAIGWTPCIGPILASILIYASNMATLGTGIILLTAYSLGLALPFILTALIIEKSTKWLKKLYPYFPLISSISGIILILMGTLVFFNKVNIIFNIGNI